MGSLQSLPDTQVPFPTLGPPFTAVHFSTPCILELSLNVYRSVEQLPGFCLFQTGPLGVLLRWLHVAQARHELAM